MDKKPVIFCSMCGESGSLIEKTVYTSLMWIEYYCNVCGHSWKIKEEKK
jgi:rRNA maturation endonuclease Nob1